MGTMHSHELPSVCSVLEESRRWQVQMCARDASVVSSHQQGQRNAQLAPEGSMVRDGKKHLRMRAAETARQGCMGLAKAGNSDHKAAELAQLADTIRAQTSQQ